MSTSALTIGPWLAALVASKVLEWFSDGAAHSKEVRWILLYSRSLDIDGSVTWAHYGGAHQSHESGTVQRRERLSVGAGGGGCASTSELTIGPWRAALVASKVLEWFSDGAARGKEARWILV